MRLLVCWLLVALAPAARARECETMKVPFCEKMPYQDTRLPNLFGHTTQGEVNKALEPLQDLRDSGCFGHYSFVLCSALAPPCMADMQQPAPCRHVCERARERCYGLMLMFNVTEAWPDCDLLPRHGADSLCLSPTTLTPRDNCHCLKKHHQPKPTTDLMDKKDYDYAIKARMEGFAPSHFPSILSVTVLDIFRDGIVEQTKNNVTFIRTNTSCKCPELESGKEYLIMGYEDFDRNELLLGKKSYVAPWSDQVALDYGNEASRNYQDSSSRTYSQRYGNYVRHHGYSMGFHRPSFTTLMMAGGAYALYRHYSNKKKLGKVYGYPGYGGYGSSFGALGGGGFGALGNPRGKYTNFNTVGAAPAYGNYGYNNYNNYNSFGRPGSQVPSYPITHKPNYATSKPDFVNRNRNPSYPVTKKPYRTSSGSRSTSSRSGSSSRSSRRSSSSRRSWGRSSRSRFGGRGGGRKG
ncbi:secreted frizzled-related protein 3-like [Pollicipes pollicipes]|uniref:secreted frizzled-related protein 3-like n=2 Tax=Pollicipes pollicipes TaxID=41117 RepID=UPI001884ED85|nr:secreted frizzled-related protein 3-like [Pollicipes pollicipes]